MTGLTRTTFLFLCVLFMVFLAACGSDDPAQAPSGGDGTIGPAGGTVSDAGGAAVEIPAGALAQETVITVKSFADPATGPYPTCPVPVFLGGAQFGPTGTVFAKPVRVMLPTRASLTPGASYQLFVYDQDNQRWVVEKSPAVVAPGGRALLADVTHFSMFNGGGASGGGQARSDITSLLCGYGSAEAVCRAYVAFFKEYIADMGDKGVYDAECKEVCGLWMDITCDINGDNYFLPVREGEFVGEQTMIHDPDDCSEGDGDYALLEATSTIYYRCTQPEMSASADPGEIELGGSSSVTATLLCGEMAFPGQDVQFDRVGFGQLDRHNATTDQAGLARTTYSNDEHEGETTITAYYHACSGQANAGTVTGETVVDTRGGWTGTLVVDFEHPIGSAPLDVFADAVSIDFDLTIDDQGNITGTGTGTHSVDVTPGGECWLSSLEAPGFDVLVAGTATGESLDFVVYPYPMMPVSFVITCQQGDDTQEYPYPMAEGLIEGAILTQDIMISVARQDGATDSGSGSRSEGTDIPMFYSYAATVNKGG